jgi:hypothetical protein
MEKDEYDKKVNLPGAISSFTSNRAHERRNTAQRLPVNSSELPLPKMQRRQIVYLSINIPV